MLGSDLLQLAVDSFDLDLLPTQSGALGVEFDQFGLVFVGRLPLPGAPGSPVGPSALPRRLDMNVVPLVPLAGVSLDVSLFALGYLLTRSRAHRSRRRRGSPNSSAARSAQADDLRTDCDAARRALHDHETAVTGQSAELRDLTEQFGQLDGDFQTAQDRLSKRTTM